VDTLPRPRSVNPRSSLIAFRVTADERAVLDAVAAIEKVGANEAAHAALLRTLEAAKRDELVRDQMRIHRRAAQRSAGKVVSIKKSVRKRR
jgi:hypothetical protein